MPYVMNCAAACGQTEEHMMSKDHPGTLCKYCGGEIVVRNPTGRCDHLYWPELLTDEAKAANGYKQVQVSRWVRE